MLDWKLYNHCWMSMCFQPNMEPVLSNKIWEKGGLFACWVTDFDCADKTGWWHIIKDTPFEIEKIKSDVRKKIRRGGKNFEIRLINGVDYSTDIYEIQKGAQGSYRNAGNAILTIEDVKKGEAKRTGLLFGAFEREHGRLCGFASVHLRGKSFSFDQLKVLPEYERLRINESLVYGRLLYLNDKLRQGYYVDAGSRNVSHDTHHQDFLQEKFGFRRAYCHLHFIVNPQVRKLVACLFHFRYVIRMLKRFLGWNLVRQVDAVLMMMEESMERKCGWRLSPQESI